AWVRDTGPTFVINNSGEVRGVNWDFNAWGGFDGGLYAPWNRDSQVGGKILEIERAPRYRTEGFVLEGGSIHVDGEG
ncbi:agmatine deiminase family protein, partial [Klebsiella pneumoniae]